MLFLKKPKNVIIKVQVYRKKDIEGINKQLLVNVNWLNKTLKGAFLCKISFQKA